MLRRLKGTPKLSEMIYKILYKDMCIFLGREDNFPQSRKGSRDPKRLETTVHKFLLIWTGNILTTSD